MPPTHPPPTDPFTDAAPLRPTTSTTTTTTTTNPALRPQSSQHSLRSNTSHASAASTRARTTHQPTNLFASTTTLSRRPTSRTTPHHNSSSGGAILADSDSEPDVENEGASVPRQRRRVRRVGGSPEVKAKGKDRGDGVKEEEVEFVNRRADGGYLLGVPGFGAGGGVGETVAVPVVAVPRTEEEREVDEVDAHYSAIARQYFASGAALGGKGVKKHEEELEQLRLPMLLRLREVVTDKLEGERWQYEDVERVRGMM